MGGLYYLDPRYEMIDNQVPEVHVTYIAGSYPDYADGGLYVTRIEITDPSITVYGLNIHSSQEEIDAKFASLGFSKTSEFLGKLYWKKNNCSFMFLKNEIRIDAHVSNREGAVF